MKLVIDGRLIHNESDLHDLLAAGLDFGPYYGRNLDALWDRLSTDVERPLDLVWQYSARSREMLGNRTFERFAALLQEVMEQDERHEPGERFTVRFE